LSVIETDYLLCKNFLSSAKKKKKNQEFCHDDSDDDVPLYAFHDSSGDEWFSDGGIVYTIDSECQNVFDSTIFRIITGENHPFESIWNNDDDDDYAIPKHGSTRSSTFGIGLAVQHQEFSAIQSTPRSSESSTGSHRLVLARGNRTSTVVGSTGTRTECRCRSHMHTRNGTFLFSVGIRITVSISYQQCISTLQCKFVLPVIWFSNRSKYVLGTNKENGLCLIRELLFLLASNRREEKYGKIF
jgi:hypothetical protein